MLNFYCSAIFKFIYSQNPVFEKWITEWAKHSNDMKFLGKVPALLHEVRSEPLGLGTGELIIGEAFVLKVIQ